MSGHLEMPATPVMAVSATSIWGLFGMGYKTFIHIPGQG
jgi:hypothetical protein